MPSHQQVYRVGYHLGVGLQGAMVTETLKVAPVGPIRGDLAIMNDRPVQDVEGMCTAPPARRVGGESTVSCPYITLVLLQAEVFGYLLRIAHTLEYRHILAAGENEGIFYSGVDLHHHFHNIVIL